MKKLLILSLLIVLTLLCACGTIPEQTTKAPTEQIAEENTTEASTEKSTEAQTEPHRHVVAVDAAKKPTCTETGLSEGSHCSECGVVWVEQVVIEARGHDYTATFDRERHGVTCHVCGDSQYEEHNFVEGAEACADCPFFKDTPPETVKGYITTELTYIETEYVLYEISDGVYVREDLAELTDELCRTMEKVSGLSFKTDFTQGKKILARVDNSGKEFQYTEAGDSAKIPVANWGAQESERGDQCANGVYLTPDCLFIGKNSAILHEFSHTLRFCQNYGKNNTVLEEGFASIVEVKTLQYLEEIKSPISYLLCFSYDLLFSYEIVSEVLNIYDNDMAYWFSLDQTFYRPLGNHNYAFGLRFLSYLEDTYGDYTAWMLKSHNGGLTVEQEIATFEDAYGEGCFEGFYPWLKENESRFKSDLWLYSSPATSVKYDMTGISTVVPYPNFTNAGRDFTFLDEYSIKYEDLYVSFDETRYYLESVRGRNIDGLKLLVSEPVMIQLFDSEGYLLRETTDQEISLDGVSYLKLVGKGELGRMWLVGYYAADRVYDNETVIYTQTVDEEFAFGDLAINGYRHDFDFGVLYRDDVVVTVRLSKPCPVEVKNYKYRTERKENVTEFVISGAVNFFVRNAKGVTVEIVVSPRED